jgi:hypothetical protein
MLEVGKRYLFVFFGGSPLFGVVKEMTGEHRTEKATIVDCGVVGIPEGLTSAFVLAREGPGENHIVERIPDGTVVNTTATLYIVPCGETGGWTPEPVVYEGEEAEVGA